MSKKLFKNKNQGNLVNRDDHLDKKYGKKGTPLREQYAEEFEAFKISVLTKEINNNS